VISRGKLFRAFLIIFVSASTAFCQSPPEKSDQTLYFTTWEGSFLSHHRRGSACWVLDAEGNLRFEILIGGRTGYPMNRDQLLDWNGSEGYTVVSIESGGATYSPWFQQWQPLSKAWDTWLRTLIGQTSGGLTLPAGVLDVSIEGRSLNLPVFSRSGEKSRIKRLQLPKLTKQESKHQRSYTALRQKMVRRGLGGGGQDSILSLSDSAQDNKIRITSSHLPFTLLVDQPMVLAAAFSPEEVFLPWWPLAQALQLK